MNHTILNDFSDPIEIKAGYESFFSGIMNIVANQKVDDYLGNNLRNYVAQFLCTCDLSDFQEFSDTLYKRIYLGKDFARGWEAIMMCWKKGNQTSIHGHPQFAAYNFASGKFSVEIFQKQQDRLELVKKIETEGGNGFFAIGEENTFDNHIHRITCLSETGHSLHVYSDDARQGRTFPESI